MTDTLQQQIDRASQSIRTDSYSMSIGEIANLYRDQEIIIRPAFQRLFRWSEYQKSRLVESIVLGIPIPPIFVSQREDGVWEVVDGLQRLSTILEFLGVLLDESGCPKPASKLVGTDYLPNLNNVGWESGEELGERTFTPSQRLAFKRSKIQVQIIKEQEGQATKFDLFDRLNSGGAQLSDQELRNAKIVMENADFADWLEGLRNYDEFQVSVAPSDRQTEQQYDLELVVRFLVMLRLGEEAELKNYRDLRNLLDQQALEFASSDEFDREANARIFHGVFGLLAKVFQDQAFRRFDAVTNRFLGGFSVSAFEAISLGVAVNLAYWQEMPEEGLRSRVKQLWSDEGFRRDAGGGKNPMQRLPRTAAVGRRLFGKS